jgi:hypothetical protein
MKFYTNHYKGLTHRYRIDSLRRVQRNERIGVYAHTLVDPAVKVLRDRTEYPDIDQYPPQFKALENWHFALDYPDDINPACQEELLAKTKLRIQQFRGHPHFIPVMQYHLLDWDGVLEAFEECENPRILGVGNLCRIHMDYKGWQHIDFAHRVISYVVTRSVAAQIHFYGLALRLIKYLCQTTRDTSRFSVDSTKWTRVVDNQLRAELVARCRLDGQEVCGRGRFNTRGHQDNQMLFDGYMRHIREWTEVDA